MSSPPSSPRRSGAAHNGDERPRFFDSKAKSRCWAAAAVVPGRHPERWRRDAAGNVVCKRFCNCQGCLCFEYDHIVPFSKGHCLCLSLFFFRKEFVMLAAGGVMGGFCRVFVSAGGESTAENCQILQTRVNRFKSDKEAVDAAQLKGYSCDVQFTDKELDIIEMAVYGDVIRPGKECRCKTVAEMLGTFKSKDHKAACKLPYSNETL
ncbi:hypothetical protein ACJRO7_009735 [Eucalyptus globulus]|uniref:HNH endonuclease domain-containing protein n=1 Tax=Eucalyptus globulus TaxID=34317 RepID=A0ABD3LEL1_EUCGL